MNDVFRRHRTQLEGGVDLLQGVINALPMLSRRQAREAIRAGLVQVDETLETDPAAAVSAGSHQLVVDLAHGIPHPKARSDTPLNPDAAPFTVLYEDQDVVVLDKAAGILSAPGSDEEGRTHVLDRLRRSWRAQGRATPYLGVVHRIDLATSGCLVVACNRQAQTMLASQFAGSGAGRRYTALVAGQPRRNQDTLTGLIGRGLDGRRGLVAPGMPGKEVVTHFQVRQRYALGSHLELELETGRTHQIRVHLAAIGCPVLGDPLYGPPLKQRARDKRRNADRDQKRFGNSEAPLAASPAVPRPPRLMLHAHEVAFDHPHTGKRVTVEAPLPELFAQVIKALGPVAAGNGQ